jgi:hypothetical protein
MMGSAASRGIRDAATSSAASATQPRRVMEPPPENARVTTLPPQNRLPHITMDSAQNVAGAASGG